MTGAGKPVSILRQLMRRVCTIWIPPILRGAFLYKGT